MSEILQVLYLVNTKTYSWQQAAGTFWAVVENVTLEPLGGRNSQLLSRQLGIQTYQMNTRRPRGQHSSSSNRLSTTNVALDVSELDKR